MKELSRKFPYILHDAYLFKGNRLSIPAGSLRDQIIRELHGGGHFGRDKTLAMVAEPDFWPKIIEMWNAL